jgi:hypothetical protein
LLRENLSKKRYARSFQLPRRGVTIALTSHRLPHPHPDPLLQKAVSQILLVIASDRRERGNL